MAISSLFLHRELCHLVSDASLWHCFSWKFPLPDPSKSLVVLELLQSFLLPFFAQSCDLALEVLSPEVLWPSIFEKGCFCLAVYVIVALFLVRWFGQHEV
jgi:hypothetical protein